jgi:hypothetical protein
MIFVMNLTTYSNKLIKSTTYLEKRIILRIKHLGL